MNTAPNVIKIPYKTKFSIKNPVLIIIKSLATKVTCTITCLILFVGCATPPPPKITATSYENYEYEFGLEVPTGWKIINVDRFKKFYSAMGEKVEDLTVEFYNKSTYNRVSVNSLKLSIPYNMKIIPRNSEVNSFLENTFDESLKKIVKTFENNEEIESKAQIFPKKECTKEPCLLVTNNFIVQDKKKVKTKNIIEKIYLYQCNEQNLCIAKFTLISEPNNYQKDIIGLTALTRSLQHNVSPATE